MVKRADTRIQQMTFMILFVFIFFILVGLFFLMFYSKDLKSSAQARQIDLAISSLETIANLPELNCESQKSFCLDEDKLLVFSSTADQYKDFWPVSYIKVRKIFPKSNQEIRCPAPNCTYFEVFDSGNNNGIIGRDVFVSICKKEKKFGNVYEECSIGKLDVGVLIRS